MLMLAGQCFGQRQGRRAGDCRAQLGLVFSGKVLHKAVFIGQNAIRRTAQAAKFPHGIHIAQGNVFGSTHTVKIKQRPQVPMAADDAGRQTGQVGAGQPNAIHIHADQLGCPHFGGQLQRHIVPPAAVNVLYPVNLIGTQRREAGGRGQHIIFQLPLRDIIQRTLHAAQGVHFGNHQTVLDVGCPDGVLVHVLVNGLTQRFGVQPAAAQSFQQEITQFLRRFALWQFQHAVVIQAAPQVCRFVHLAHHKQCCVQAAHTGTSDHIRQPAKFHQCLIHTNLITSLCAAARKHQPAHGIMFFCHILHLPVVSLYLKLVSLISNGYYFYESRLL